MIEGACRYLIKDRMDITGARWSLQGAEAVLRLRSLHLSGDWADYWQFHLQQEHQRNHRARYQSGIPWLKSVTQARCSTPPPSILIVSNSHFEKKNKTSSNSHFEKKQGIIWGQKKNWT